MIVLRTPKGWTGPTEVDGVPVEGTFRCHQYTIVSCTSMVPSVSMVTSDR